MDASEQVKKKNDDIMSGLTGGMQMPKVLGFPLSPFTKINGFPKSLPGLG